MAAIRAASEKLVLGVQWALAVFLFQSGLVEAGLPLDELQARFGLAADAEEPALVLAGLAQAVVAVLLVAPTTTGFLPALSPIAAVAVAVAFGAAASGFPVPVGLGAPFLVLAVAVTAGALALARGVLLPVAALELGPERRDPWHRPTAQLERLRRHAQAVGRPPPEQADPSPERTPEPASSRRRGAAAPTTASTIPPRGDRRVPGPVGHGSFSTAASVAASSSTR